MTPATKRLKRIVVLPALTALTATVAAANPAHANSSYAAVVSAADDEPGAAGGEAEVYVGELSAPGDSFGPASDPEPEPEHAATPTSTSSEPPLCIQEATNPSPALHFAEGGPEGDTHEERWDAFEQAWDDADQEQPDQPWSWTLCRDPNIDCDSIDDCVYDQPNGDPTWNLPGEAGPVTTQADLINDLYADLQGMVETPVVSTNPGPDQASIVNVPTFFTVDNWQGAFDAEPECAPEDPDFCVWATLTPHLSLDPGEPDAPTIDCEGPGQPYDPDAWTDDPFTQADWPETCTYAYTKRTGTDDREDYWTATLTITWDIEWFPDDAEGTPTLDATTEITREVHEIHAVVTD